MPQGQSGGNSEGQIKLLPNPGIGPRSSSLFAANVLAGAVSTHPVQRFPNLSNTRGFRILAGSWWFTKLCKLILTR